VQVRGLIARRRSGLLDHLLAVRWRDRGARQGARRGLGHRGAVGASGVGAVAGCLATGARWHRSGAGTVVGLPGHWSVMGWTFPARKSSVTSSAILGRH